MKNTLITIAINLIMILMACAVLYVNPDHMYSVMTFTILMGALSILRYDKIERS